MDTILALREKRKNLWDAAKAFLDTARDENGMVSAEDAARYDKMEADVVNLGKEIDRLERQQQLDAQLAQPTTMPITELPGAGQNGAEKKGRASDAYRKAFWDSIRHKNFIDVQNALSAGTDADGGYLVPDEFEHQLIDKLQEENGLYPDSQDTFGQQSIGAYKLGTAIRVSEELLNDSAFDLESYIAGEFARRIGTKEEEAFLVGDGKNKPTGVFPSAEVGVTVTTASITFDDVIDLYHSLRIPYRRKAVWLLNDATIKALRKVKDNNGNYIWQPSVTAGTPDTILNRPCYCTSFAPELAAGNRPMLFGDFSYYWIADREYRSFKRLNELYAANGQIGFLASQRVDGMLMLKEAVKALEMKAKG